MHQLVIGLVVAIMALFPRPDEGGISSYQRWMEAYEKFLYAQMAANFEREKAETVTFEPKNAVSQQNTEAKVEQAPVEEVQEEAPGADIGGVDSHIDNTADNTTAEETNPAPAPVETTAESTTAVPETQAPTVAPQTEAPTQAETFPIYSVNGAVLDVNVQHYLYQRLCEAGIGWFYETSLLIAYQESRFNPVAENPNGRDKGLFQYRIEYHPGLDWRNPYAETDIFVVQMAQRANIGCSIPDMISRHKQSDYGPYDEAYVQQVAQWRPTLVRIQ